MVDYQGTNSLQGGGGGTGTDKRISLTANTTYYVSTTGSNSNSGTLASPWLTPQFAVDWIGANVDGGGFAVTVQLADGTYPGFQIGTTLVGLGFFTIQGNVANKTLVIINDNYVGPYTTTYATISVETTTFNLINQHFTIDSSTGAGNDGFAISAAYSTATTNDIGYTASGGSGGAALALYSPSFLLESGVRTITGNWGSYFTQAIGSEINSIGGSFTLTAATIAIFLVSEGTTRFGTGWAATGTSTGQKYSLDVATVTAVGHGNDLSFLPGSVAGTITSGMIGPDTYGGAYPATFTNGHLRATLTAAITFYVSTTGSDSNPGTLASPWATLTHAMQFISENIDAVGQTITVSIGAGSFAGFGARQVVGGGILQFTGAGSALTTITAGPNDGTFNLGDCVTINTPCAAVLFVDKVTLNVTGVANNFGIVCYPGGITFGIGAYVAGGGDVAFNGVNGSLMIGNYAQSTFIAKPGGTYTVTGGPWLTGIDFELGANASLGGTFTAIGSPDFSNTWGYAFLTTLNFGTCWCNANMNPGTSTGRQFLVDAGSNLYARFGLLGDQPGRFPNDGGIYGHSNGSIDVQYLFTTQGALYAQASFGGL